jgi:hypothetical protein
MGQFIQPVAGFRVSKVMAHRCQIWSLCLRLCFPEDMVRTGQLNNPKMLNLTNRRSGRCAHWCALVAMIAVCSLAVRVATRYGSSDGVPTSRVNVSDSHDSQEQGRQRLTRDAAVWTPPLIALVGLDRPAMYSSVAYEGPAVSLLPFVSNPYYRPPPISSFLS